ncbi:hypothetical protein FPCIR_387 [Fusarium pseudocircinatum]|uniref:Nephrocystin 3-like N-terminal domain-containing protein n=1 Tax=Fusarium pseudocircinatum TaxID=56676 RepID=A0A8H5PXZ6_9HYPO|nr:hypothetical protein FPCIR_387 [Fusarium pseudocircinatum]
MATGFEVFGAACALVQLIQFSFKIVVGCKKFHDGEPTDHDVLAAYVHDMQENLILVERRFQSLDISDKSPPAQKELQMMADRCRDTARELQIELRYVTKKQQKNDYASAITYMFRSLLRRGKIERLRRSLDMEKSLMENRLLIQICSQNDAKDLLDDHRFINLENFKNVITTESQREEFLKSLRFPEMRKRYNDLSEPEELSFDRVFTSYESVTSEEDTAGINRGTLESSESEKSTDIFLRGIEGDRDIDSTWSVFKQWLTTSHPLFCIQGKPGSGKSTLSKFIIDNPSTKSLLSQWNPQPTILSHFFWKIGAATQNSIKGLLCSLVYQLLASDKALQEQVMEHHIGTFNAYYDDWSSRSLRNIFQHIAETRHHHLFIFIDGIDEIGNSDGMPNLIQVIEELFSFPQIKVCVSSRPDLCVTEWLKKHNAAHILLEDLTKYEMARFSLRELESFVSSAKISLMASKRFTRIIVERSKGVFLWVYLVLRSVTVGLRNGDPEELLLERLEALPSELEDLYNEMWRRMGEHSQVYQKVAAKYFHYILYGGQIV